MYKLLLCLVVFATGCGFVHSGVYDESPSAPAVRGPRPSVWPQEVMVELVNNCAEIIKVMDGYRVVQEVRGAGVHYIRVQRRPFTGQDATQVHATVQAWMIVDGAESYLGSAVGVWSLSTYRTGYRKPWQFDHLQSPSGARCRMRTAK